MRAILSFVVRAAITAGAFLWIFREVDVQRLWEVSRSIHPGWLVTAVLLFGVSELLCVTRWKLLVPAHPLLSWPFLANSFFVSHFFNIFLPTTIGGDVFRAYDLIKVTGNWRDSLASILVDRLAGMAGLVTLASISWFTFPAAREDPIVRAGFLGLCGAMAIAVGILGSRRVLRTFLKPFGKIGLGTLAAHTTQFQESIVRYRRKPKILLSAFGLSVGLQFLMTGTYWAVSSGMKLGIPPVYLLLTVPIISTVAMIPVSLNGWGIREGATILFMGRVGVSAEGALSLSLVCAFIQVGYGALGGILFLTRKLRRRRR
ncbi:MAG: flippase-like domain-containing protein [Candidatus Omnitrophica bacterium]|nr:flippase-like domain-containing protein [Candidatus Omnitrophota bacterium]